MPPLFGFVWGGNDGYSWALKPMRASRFATPATNSAVELASDILDHLEAIFWVMAVFVILL